MTIPFSIMTWNVENLFRFGGSFGPRTEAVYEQKLANLARTILNIAPDVLAVQEVGDAAAFADLQTRLEGHYPHAILAEHFDQLHPIRVGVISRLPLSNIEELFEFPQTALTDITDAQGNRIHTMGRGALKVQVTIAPGLTINVITAHLKSKLITYPNGRRSPRNEDERARETGAAAIRRIVQSVALRTFTDNRITGNEQPLILLGDFNDGPDAVTTECLQGPDDGSLARRDKFDDVRLYNLAEQLPADHRYSRLYNKKRELIDHIMVSYELIFRLRQADSFVEPIDSIGSGVESRRDAVFPDHAPLFARFELPEPSATDDPIPTPQ